MELKNIFKVHEESTPSTPIQFTVAKAVEIFDICKNSSTLLDVRKVTGLQMSTLKSLANELAEVTAMMERIVRGTAKLVREVSHIETNEETGESLTIIDTAEVLADVPESLEELITTCITLMANDYDLSGKSLFEPNEVQEDVINAMSHFISEIIRCSNVDKDATFEEWKTYTIGG